jgi:hypothetical protein
MELVRKKRDLLARKKVTEKNNPAQNVPIEKIQKVRHVQLPKKNQFLHQHRKCLPKNRN